MKKLISLFAGIFFVVTAMAQSFSINTDGSTADASAILDVKSTTKGMLIPRMSKTERIAIVSPASGLLVFQNAPDSVGFHYYNGSSWVWLEVLGNAGWKTMGNAGTDTAMHFIGTTDNMPLWFKQNNIKIADWNRNKRSYFIGVGAGNNNSIANGQISIGDSTGPNFTGTTAPGVLIGTFAGKSLTNGFNPVMIGLRAGESNTSGNANVFVGTVAGRFNTTGGGNTYIGHFAAESGTIGSNNTAIGLSSLLTNEEGSLNTALGAGADVGDDSLVNVTSVGAQSRVDTSNAMVLGSINAINGATANVNVAIGTTKPKSALHVSRGSSGNTITIPTNRISLFEDNVSNYLQLLSPDASETGILAGNASTLIKSGIVFSADSAVLIRTGGNNTRIFAGKTGLIGIGNTAPQSRLHVSSGTTAGAVYSSAVQVLESSSASFLQLMNPSANVSGIFSGTELTSARSSIFFNPDSSIGFNSPGFSSRMSIKNDGDILIPGVLGVGNTDPQSKLHVSSGTVSGAQYLSSAVQILESTSVSFLQLMNPASNASGILSGTELTNARSGIFFNADSSVTFNSPGFSSRMTVKNDGDILIPGLLGVGNTSPQTKFHVSRGTTAGAVYLTTATGIFESSVSNFLQLMNPATTTASILSGTELTNSRSGINFNADSSVSFAAGGFLTRMTIAKNGNTGINTTTPSALLDANGTFRLGTVGTVNSAILKNIVTIDVGPVAANNELDVIAAVANAGTTGAVSVSPAVNLPAGLIIAWARVSSAGNITIRYRNVTGSAIDPPSTSYMIAVIQ